MGGRARRRREAERRLGLPPGPAGRLSGAYFPVPLRIPREMIETNPPNMLDVVRVARARAEAAAALEAQAEMVKLWTPGPEWVAVGALKACEVCGAIERPQVFLGERWCSGDCRKALEALEAADGAR